MFGYLASCFLLGVTTAIFVWATTDAMRTLYRILMNKEVDNNGGY